jgi:4-diphosphocytidyl-2-C-methyl-D-erythritol kinase
MELSMLCGGPSRFDIAFAPRTTGESPAEVDWPLERDLVWRAHQLLEREVGCALPVALRLRKHIPTGAGLGGGSSDGGAMLVGLRQLFGCDVSDDRLMELASQLGSDVPFMVAAVLGEPQAIVTGLGERVRPIARPAPTWLVLVLPGISCPTGPVYGAFDRRMAGRTQEPDVTGVLRAANASPVREDLLFNDLAGPACDARPPLADVLGRMRSLGLHPHITGSGSTIFVVVTDRANGRDVADEIQESLQLPAVVTRTLK